MTRADRFIGLVLAAASVWALWQATFFPYGSEFAPGPGFAPVWLSTIGAALSLLVAFNAWRWRDRVPAEAGEAGGRAGLARVGAAMLGMLIMILLLPSAGLVLGLGLYLLFLTLAVERLTPLVGVATSLGTTAFVYVVFARLLSVPFPRGPFGF